jgi:hypothetical protein
MKTELGYYKPLDTVLQWYNNEPKDEKTLFKSALQDYPREVDKDIFGIEIGVLDGETSRFFLSLNDDINLIGIEPFVPDSMEASLIGSEDKVNANVAPYKNRWGLIKDFSYNVSERFQDNSVDFIFIDGDHNYDAVKQDFQLYNPKIKTGGLIFFHDSRMNRGGANFHVGSSKFVDEVIATHNGVKLIGEAFSLTSFIKK